MLRISLLRKDYRFIICTRCNKVELSHPSTLTSKSAGSSATVASDIAAHAITVIGVILHFRGNFHSVTQLLFGNLGVFG